MFLRFEVNKKGRDFVVGDIHGCFKRLDKFLDVIRFNPEEDRLFSVGDLLDRGTDDADIFDWMQRDWFHAVMGNHEMMVLQAADDPVYASLLGQSYPNHYWYNLPPEKKVELEFIIGSLPFMIEVDTRDGRRVGIIHADVPYCDWDMANLMIDKSYDAQQFAIWDRKRHNLGVQTFVKNIDLVVVGHNTVPSTEMLGNVINIDTGAVYMKHSFDKEGVLFDLGFTLYNITDDEFYHEGEWV